MIGFKGRGVWLAHLRVILVFSVFSFLVRPTVGGRAGATLTWEQLISSLAVTPTV